MKNYIQIETKFIEDIQSEVTIYQHKKSKARVCTIANDDTNKVFSIAFRTPPINNGGLTHILEHSVLCGSKKYPVKDPFVELIKSSLNTFLNAFTFPDKTMYPIASQNDKDFKNLMNVYMDAVFYPQIYNHKEIFMQEGWHYHLLNEEDPITYNGVVYNEMKGAFSDPQQILFRNIMHSLYPDTAYGFESGGDPMYIPDLTYEEFLDFHSKYYHPSNSYIFLYGDCDMEERLKWLDEEYLSSFKENDFDTALKVQPAFKKPISETYEYPIGKEESLKHKAFLSYNVAFPSTLDTKLMIAADILATVLINNPGAPLKQAIIDAKLGDDVSCVFDDGLLQPLLGFIVVHADQEKEEQLIKLIDQELKRLIKEGLDHEALKALINYQEFKVRESKFDYMPKGLEVELTCLGSWLYSEDQPYSKLENLKYFKELKEDVDKNYFEAILEKYILNNNHKSYVKLIPSHTCGEKKEKAIADQLKAYKDSLSKEEIKALIKENQNLAIYQSTPSTKEELDTLPKLALEDISEEPQEYHCECKDGVYRTLYSDYFTNGIGYAGYSFDLTGTDKKTIQYAQLLSDLLAYISTKKSTFTQLNQRIQNDTGGLQFSVVPYKTVKKECKVSFDVTFSSLEERSEKANDLVLEIIHETNFKDTKRLYERISEMNADLEMNIAGRGDRIGYIRSGSYFDETFSIIDATSGIGYCDFIHDIYHDFEKNQDEIISNLEATLNLIFTKKRFMFKFTGTKELYSLFKNHADQIYESLNGKDVVLKSDFKPASLNEGFKTQYDVNFVTRVGIYKEPFNGAMMVLNNALRLDYLWLKVRVNGGAYGVSLITPTSGMIGLTSYRDPEIAKTNQVYEDIVSYIKSFNPSEDDLLKYKIGAIGGLESVLHASTKGVKAQRDYLTGNTYELQSRYRKELLQANNEDIRALAPLFEECLKQGYICVIGNAGKVEENKALFTNVRNLIK